MIIIIFGNVLSYFIVSFRTRKVLCTGGTGGSLYPHRKCQEKLCTLLHLHCGYSQLRLHLYLRYDGVLTPWVRV